MAERTGERYSIWSLLKHAMGGHKGWERAWRDPSPKKSYDVIIVGGDSDFMPVAQKIEAAGRTLIGIGNRRNTNKHWAKSCHEFRYCNSLVEAPSIEEAPRPREAKATPPPPPVDPAAEMIIRP